VKQKHISTDARTNSTTSCADLFELRPRRSIEETVNFTGTQVNYYFVCRRKLWLFSHGLEMEETSDLVLLGKLLHEHGYARKRKEVQVGRIKIDFVGSGCEIHEIKRSRKAEDAHLYQLLYYLYYLKRCGGVEGKGVLHYPLLKRTVDVELTEEKTSHVESILKDMEKILSNKPPPPIKIRYCRRCSYNELCWGSD
jgi:CRISPR-associated exonuclease Cas4